MVLKRKKSFTSQELQIMKLISKGYKAQEIGKELTISKLTVETHKKNILAKTTAKNMIEVIVYCVKNRIV